MIILCTRGYKSNPIRRNEKEILIIYFSETYVRIHMAMVTAATHVCLAFVLSPPPQSTSTPISLINYDIILLKSYSDVFRNNNIVF